MQRYRWTGAATMGIAFAGALSIMVTSGCSVSNRNVRLTDEQRALNSESFEYVWSTIRDTHFDPTLGGLDWDALHDELAPEVARAETMQRARAVMSDLISRLEQTHFAIIPSSAYDDMDDEDSPGDENDDSPAGKRDGWTGIDVRVIEGCAIVTSVFAGSPADQTGVRPGWEIVEVEDHPLSGKIDAIAKEYEGKTLRSLVLSRAVSTRLTGRIGDSVDIVFRDDHDEPVTQKMSLVARRGRRIQFGHLPPTFVWIETHPVGGDIGYIAFNGFFDPNHLMKSFNDAMAQFMDYAGLIIDLRGNPGGIGGMSMGMAGWLIGSERQHLGTLQLRDSELKFVVHPRAETFGGPLVIVVDGLSASTSEIFAGGLKDIGRAQVVGTRTAGAALPSMIERLPNGDGFQYARANYVSFGGEPLEGKGVEPDIEIAPTRQSLLAGRDLVLEAAIAWIREQD